LLSRFGPGAFGGITFGDWLRVLRENHFAVDVPYWGRAAFITLASLSNSVSRRLEEWRYGEAIRAAAVHPPLFVLGIWRSGTTHLHNLLGKDDRLAFPNSYQVFNPHTFLTTEAAGSEFLAGRLQVPGGGRLPTAAQRRGAGGHAAEPPGGGAGVRL